MDKSESIMIRTRQKWRRHQQPHRHLRACPPSCSRLLCIVCPLLPPRGNRGEARRTFRLITVLQFNEKPVSVLSVHNGRRFDEAYTAGFDRDAPWIPRRCTPAAAGLARANLLTCCWPPLFDANAASAPFFSGVET